MSQLLGILTLTQLLIPPFLAVEITKGNQDRKDINQQPNISSNPFLINGEFAEISFLNINPNYNFPTIGGNLSLKISTQTQEEDKNSVKKQTFQGKSDKMRAKTNLDSKILKMLWILNFARIKLMALILPIR